MAGVKWSNNAYFPDGGDCQQGDVIMGLRNGGNYKFDFPSTGIKDGNGNYLFAWDTIGASATNYLKITNGVSGTPTEIQALGSDTNIDININTKGTGKLNVTGLFTVNGSTNINSIINDDTFATATAENVPTALSVKNYVDSSVSTPGGTNGQIQYNNSGAFGGDSITTNGSGSWTGTLSLNGQFNADNLRLDGNTLSSTDTNGNINITPNGTGHISLNGVNWSGLTNGQLFIGNTGSVPSLATITAGAGVSIVNGAGSITISAGGGGGFTWNYVSGTSSATAAANGYLTDNVSLVTLTLPTTIARGQGIAVQNIGAGLVKIAQNSGQSIHFGSSTTTVGTGGSIQITARYSGFILLCTVDNTEFAILTPPTGPVTVV